MSKRFATITAAVSVLALTLTVAVDAAVKFFTCVGGASGMTMQLSPYAAGGVQRGCAAKMMDEALKLKNTPTSTGDVYRVYTSARMKASDPAWSEPTTFGANQVKFTGDKSQCEISYIKLNNGDYLFAMVIRADSVIGLRWTVNRQSIYDFVTLKSGMPIYAAEDGTAPTTATHPDWESVVKPAIENMLPKNGGAGIPIEGGLTECYIESGVKAIDRYNRLFPPTETGDIAQPQLNPANYRTTKDNILAVAVMAIIYNKSVQDAINGQGSIQALNMTTQMERLITGGFVDNWDCFFSNQIGYHEPLINYWREPLSGTGITYLSQIMRGVEPKPNGTRSLDAIACSDATSPNNGKQGYHGSGIPDLTCIVDPTSHCWANKPGGGAVNNAVNLNTGSHAYTFLQKFTDNNGNSPLADIRVAKFNGYEPYDFSAGNSLPGVNGVPDVDSVTNPQPGRHYFQSVIDGKYQLWTYNHCFDATNGQSTNLSDYVKTYSLVNNAWMVRAVGLIPLNDMNTMSFAKTPPSAGSPNEGRGPGFGRCSYVSPLTGEEIRDGMMFILNDPNGSNGLPGEGYVDMRP